MKKLLTVIAFTLLVQFPAVAGDFYDNPWKLKSPVRLKPADHAHLYKHVIFTGWLDDIDAYVNYHRLKVKVFVDYWAMGVHITDWETIGTGKFWGACNHDKSGYAHQIVCVAVDK